MLTACSSTCVSCPPRPKSRSALNADDATAYVAVCAYELAHVLACRPGLKDKESIPTERRELGEVDFRCLLLVNFFSDALADHARAVACLGAAEKGDCGKGESEGQRQRRVHVMPNVRAEADCGGRQRRPGP